MSRVDFIKEVEDFRKILILAGLLFILLGLAETIDFKPIPGSEPYLRGIGGVLLTVGIILYLNNHKHKKFVWILPIIFGVVLFILPVGSPPQQPLPNNTIYSDSEVDTTIHSIRFLELVATSSNNPPQVNDRITIEFTLQNIDENPIKLLATFVAARNPFGENKDFGDSNQDKTIQPQEIIKTKANIIVDNKGIWEFGPCYSLDIPEISDEENLCPSEWRRFQILVK